MNAETTDNPDKKIDVLVIDDDPLYAGIIKAFLDGPVYRTWTASDGRAALGMCANKHYSVIISDVEMSDINGLDFVRTLRGLSTEFLTTPIIPLSASSADVDIHRGRESGCDDYLTKPVTKKLLLSVVSHRLDRENQIAKSAEAKLLKFYQRISCRTFSSTCCPRCFFYAQRQGDATRGTCPAITPAD